MYAFCYILFWHQSQDNRLPGPSTSPPSTFEQNSDPNATLKEAWEEVAKGVTPFKELCDFDEVSFTMF